MPFTFRPIDQIEELTSSFASGTYAKWDGSIFSGDTPAGGASSPSPLLFYDDGIFKVTGTAVSFGDGLLVHVTGSVAYVDWTGSAGGGGDAEDITYTPAVATDWDSDADPGNVDDALDQLAERVDDVEDELPFVSQVLFYYYSTLVAEPINMLIDNHTGRTLTLLGVYLRVVTAPTGAVIVVDIHKDGSTIFTTQANRPQIVIGAYTGNSTTLDTTDWNDGEYLEAQIDQIGSTIAGADLVITVVYK